MTSHHRRTFIFLGSSAVVALCFSLAGAGERFVNVVDDMGIASGFDGPPALNDSGMIAFKALSEDTFPAIFTAQDTTVTRVAQARFPSPFIGFWGTVDLNNAGTVAFEAETLILEPIITNGGRALYTAGDGTLTRIAGRSDGFEDFSGIPGLGGGHPSALSISDTGAVAFRGETAQNTQGIYLRRPGGPIQPLYDSQGDFNTFASPSLNDQGTVAFYATRDDGQYAIYVGDGGPPQPIHEPLPPPSSANTPDVNSTGAVAFSTGLLRGMGGGGVHVGSGGLLTTIVDRSGPFDDFAIGPAINDRGQVAFIGRLDSGRMGIFRGPDPIADKVIAIGDPLFGSTLTGFDFFRNGFNNLGHVAFAYELANRRQGIAIAMPETSAVDGDYNDNGQVEQADLDLVLLQWGGSFETLPAGWVHQRPTSGIVDQAELDAVLLHWGNSAVRLGSTEVPEPATFLVAVLTAVVGIVRRR